MKQSQYRILEIFFVILFVAGNVSDAWATTQLDSLLTLLPKSKNYKERIDLMCRISRLYRESDADKAVSFARKTIALAEQTHDTANLARIYEIYGHTLGIHGDYPMSLQFFNKALDILENKNDAESQARKYHILAYKINFETMPHGNIHQLKYGYFKKCDSLYKILNDHEGLAYTYYGLAQAYLHQADIFFRKDLYGPIPGDTIEKNMKIDRKNILSKSIFYFIESGKEARLAGMNDRYAAALVGYGSLISYLGDTTQCIAIIKKALLLHKKENGLIGEANCLMRLAKLFKGKQQNDSTLAYANKALAIYKQTKYNIEISWVLDFIANIYENKQDYPAALKYLKLSWEHQKNYYNENRTSALYDIQNSYENKLKNIQIAKLKSDAQIAELQTKQREYIIAGGVGLLVLLISIGTFVYYQKEKTLIEMRKNAELTQLLNKNLEQKTRDAELTAVRAQMNPHFVFNVMGSIQGLIVSNRQQEAIDYLNDFSKLTRQTLMQSEQKFIRLSEEIAFLKNYLLLESLRFENRFEIVWEINGNINTERVEIPPMLIQPFVENAIKHGLLPKREKGKLTIKFDCPIDDVLMCEIIDNGVGRNYVEKFNTSHTSKGIALTEKRLELFNFSTKKNSPFTINILDLADETGKPVGTKVELSISITNPVLA